MTDSSMVAPDRTRIVAALDEIRRLIAGALAAGNTREIARLAVGAQATAVGLRLQLDDLLHDENAILDSHLNRGDLEAARNALGNAINRAEAVGLGTDAASMRSRVADFQAEAEEAAQAIMQVFGTEGR